MELIGSFGSRPITRQKGRCVVRSRLRSRSAAGKSISWNAVIHIGSVFTRPYRPNPPRFGEWFGQRREDNEAVSFSITQSAESHLRAAGTRAGLRTDPSRFGERRTARAGIPGGHPTGRVPVLVDDGVTLTESQAILAYLGDKTGRLWPASAAGRAQALQWLFFLSQHVMPAAGEVALRICSRVTGVPADETVIASGEKALPPVLSTDGSKSWDGRSSTARRTSPEVARGSDDPPGHSHKRGYRPSLRARRAIAACPPLLVPIIWGRGGNALTLVGHHHERDRRAEARCVV